jgi:hypothetical protein
MMHAMWLHNCTTTKNTPNSTPYEKATGRKPDLVGLPLFGAHIWVKVDAASKLDAKSKPARWVGYDAMSKGHRIWWPGTTRVSVKRNVIFMAEEELTSRIPLEGERLPDGEQNARIEELESVPTKSPDPSVQGESQLAPPNQAPESVSEPSVVPSSVPEAPVRRLLRVRKPSSWA